jgi:hypothetical protein
MVAVVARSTSADTPLTSLRDVKGRWVGRYVGRMERGGGACAERDSRGAGCETLTTSAVAKAVKGGRDSRTSPEPGPPVREPGPPMCPCVRRDRLNYLLTATGPIVYPAVIIRPLRARSGGASRPARVSSLTGMGR